MVITLLSVARGFSCETTAAPESFGVRYAHRAYERRHPGVIFHALGARRFDAARDIDRVRAHAMDRITDVLRVQPTTQNGPTRELCWNK
jgi:hypothetical protein